MLYTDFFLTYSDCYDNLSDNSQIYKIKELPLKETIETTDDLDKISYDYYSDETLWFIIAIYNDIVNPFFDNINRTLKIPDINGIEDIAFRDTIIK